jgi:hypothetical protein
MLHPLRFLVFPIILLFQVLIRQKSINHDYDTFKIYFFIFNILYGSATFMIGLERLNNRKNTNLYTYRWFSTISDSTFYCAIMNIASLLYTLATIEQIMSYNKESDLREKMINILLIPSNSLYMNLIYPMHTIFRVFDVII